MALEKRHQVGDLRDEVNKKRDRDDHATKGTYSDFLQEALSRVIVVNTLDIFVNIAQISGKHTSQMRSL